MKTMSIDVFKYALGFVDSFSRLGAVYLLGIRAEIETIAFEGKIVTDTAREFKFGDFADICLQQGIDHEFTR